MNKHLFFLFSIFVFLYYFPVVAQNDSDTTDEDLYVTFTTDLPIGSSIRIAITTNDDDRWIDLNANNIKDDGEQIEKSGRFAFQNYTVGSENITIHANVLGITATLCGITSIDLSHAPFLGALRLQGNKLENIDLSSNIYLSICAIHANKLKSVSLPTRKGSFLKSLSLFQNSLGRDIFTNLSKNFLLKGTLEKAYVIVYNSNLKSAEFPEVPENNECPKSVVDIMKSRKWSVLDANGDMNNCLEYQGTTEASRIVKYEKDENVPYRVENGQIFVDPVFIGDEVALFKLDGEQIFYHKVTGGNNNVLGISLADKPATFILKINNKSYKVVLKK